MRKSAISAASAVGVILTSSVFLRTTRHFEIVVFFANSIIGSNPQFFSAISAMLIIKFLPSCEGIYQTPFRSVVSVEISGSGIDPRSSAVRKGFGCGSAALCPLWLIGFGCGFATLRSLRLPLVLIFSASPWWVLVICCG
jgi:hypothetical protein